MTGATRAERGKLGGLRHREVVRLLAAGDLSQTEIAKRYGVAQPSVSQFARKHAEEIRQVREAMDDEFAGMAIASKVNRVRLLQEIAEQALVPVPKISANGTTTYAINPETGESEMVMEVDGRLAAQVLKQVAEELGQLVQRSQSQAEVQATTTYRIESVSVEDLK